MSIPLSVRLKIPVEVIKVGDVSVDYIWEVRVGKKTVAHIKKFPSAGHVTGYHSFMVNVPKDTEIQYIHVEGDSIKECVDLFITRWTHSLLKRYVDGVSHTE